MSRKKSKNRLIKIFVDYGIQLTILFFFCNIVLIYALHFLLFASTGKTSSQTTSTMVSTGSALLTQSITPTITPQDTLTPTPSLTPYPTAVGPLLSISFDLPGIGTNGGNLKPIHPVRDLSVLLFSPDANTSDKNVKPIYTINTQAIYDSDPNSPTYALYINQHLDLGEIKDGQYQIAFQTPQALRQIIKDGNSKSVAGKIFDLSGNRSLEISKQNLITGDIYPYPISDNKMDINDYLLLQDCFGIKSKSTGCPSSIIADLDDNGVVDGIDYNIMLINFRYLGTLGYPIPKNIVPTPTSGPVSTKLIDPLKKATFPLPTIPTKLPDVKNVTKSSHSGNGLIMVIILVLIIIGGIVFSIYKFHLIDLLLHKNNPEKDDLVPETNSEVDSNAPGPDNQLSDGQNEEVVNVPEDHNMGDIQSSKPDDPNMIVKSGYLKVVTTDNKVNGTWVTLADDNGINRGFYNGVNIRAGFVKIKGTQEIDKENKPYILIKEIQPED